MAARGQPLTEVPPETAVNAHGPSIVVCPLDDGAEQAARERQSQLLKPPGALGRLEALATWLAATSGNPRPQVRPRIVIAAADHGVALHEGVSAYPSQVTGQMLGAFLQEMGAISVLAKQADADVVLVDAGVHPDWAIDDPRIVKTGLPPSANLALGPALTSAEVARAVDTGRRLAAEAARDGVTVLVGGEMGIGNTTPATCLAAALTHATPGPLTGPGTGLDGAGVAHKRDVIERALALHGADDPGPLGWLRRVGGGEIAVLCGLALGAGEQGLAYLCDGVIATSGAAVAAEIAPDLLARMAAGHRSPEPAHTALLEHLGLDPILDLGMRLGEGSGAAAALAILRLACATHNEMATFADAGVSGPQADS